MAESKNKPLFNRRYLLILVWVLPIVILFLQQGVGERPIDNIRWDAELQAYVLPNEQDDIQLELLLPLPQTLTDQAWIDTRVQIQAVQQRLSQAPMTDWLSTQGWRAQVSEAATHLKIDIEAKQPPSAQQLEQFYTRLKQLEMINREPLRKRAQAERYLASQQDESRLLAALGEQLSDTADLFAAKPVWLLTADIDKAEGSAPTTGSNAASRPWTPGSVRLDVSPRNPDASLTLIGQPQPAPKDGAELARQRLGAELMAQLLSHSFGKMDYRWTWKPLAQNGYRALVLPSSPTTRAWLADPSLASRGVSKDLLEQTRASLLSRYDQILTEEPQRWLELVGLYHLPLDSHQAFRDTLNTIDLDAARALITNLLDPGQSLQIRFASTGNPS